QMDQGYEAPTDSKHRRDPHQPQQPDNDPATQLSDFLAIFFEQQSVADGQDHDYEHNSRERWQGHVRDARAWRSRISRVAKSSTVCRASGSAAGLTFFAAKYATSALWCRSCAATS